MKNKMFFGLFGCSSDGRLYTPNGRLLMKLPKRLAFWIHTFLNERMCYVGLNGTKYIWGKKDEE